MAKLKNIKTIENVLDTTLLEKLNKYIQTKSFFEYTEHPGRHGYKIEYDDPVYKFLNLNLKLKILESFDETDNINNIKLSDVILCKDEEGFELPIHTDDIYKYISCVIYLVDDIPGTSFLLGIGIRKEIKAETNKLLYFKSKDLYHNVNKTKKQRFTLQFHYKNVSTLNRFINLIGFDNQVLKKIKDKKNEQGILLDTTIIGLLDDSFSINIVSKNNDFIRNELSIHKGIYPELKTNIDYKKCFFSFEKNFLGLSRNFLYDANNNASYTHFIRNKYVMISRGSWNQKHKTYFPIIDDSFKRFYEDEEIVLKSWWSDNYRISHVNNAVVIFVQNYSKYEYWFGWEKDDVNIWLSREKAFVEKVYQSTKKTIYIKFHPKMETIYVDEYKKNIKAYDIKYFSQKEKLDYIFDKVDSCVINSGSTAIMSMIYGLPTFCIDDTYSSIPVHKLACNDIEDIDKICESNLPNRKENLDFIFSQIFSINELQKKSINELFQFE